MEHSTGSFGSREKKGGKCGQRESNEMPLVWLEFSKEREGKVVFPWECDSHISWESLSHEKHGKVTFP